VSDVINHPTWCDPAECAVEHPDSCHRSAVHRIEAASFGDIGIAARLVSSADEPVVEAPVVLELRLIRSLGISVEGYDLNGDAVRKLHALLGRLIPALPART
jgi:hypothetical protein